MKDPFTSGFLPLHFPLPEVKETHVVSSFNSSGLRRNTKVPSTSSLTVAPTQQSEFPAILASDPALYSFLALTSNHTLCNDLL